MITMADGEKTQVGLATAGALATTAGGLLVFLNPIVGGVTAGAGVVLSLVAGALNPARTAARRAWEAKGFSSDFADTYGKWFQQPESAIQQEMEQVAGKLAETGDSRYGHELQALTTILRERNATARDAVRDANALVSTGTAPWAGLGMLGILSAAGIVLIALRRR